MSKYSFSLVENVVYYIHAQTVSTRPHFREEWSGDETSIFKIDSEENSMNVIQHLVYFVNEFCDSDD